MGDYINNSSSPFNMETGNMSNHYSDPIIVEPQPLAVVVKNKAIELWDHYVDSGFRYGTLWLAGITPFLKKPASICRSCQPSKCISLPQFLSYGSRMVMSGGYIMASIGLMKSNSTMKYILPTLFAAEVYLSWFPIVYG